MAIIYCWTVPLSTFERHSWRVWTENSFAFKKYSRGSISHFHEVGKGWFRIVISMTFLMIIITLYMEMNSSLTFIYRVFIIITSQYELPSNQPSLVCSCFPFHLIKSKCLAQGHLDAGFKWRVEKHAATYTCQMLSDDTDVTMVTLYNNYHQ